MKRKIRVTYFNIYVLIFTLLHCIRN